MGIYSEIDMEQKLGSEDDPFAEDTQRPLTSPYAAGTPHPQPAAQIPVMAVPTPPVQAAPPTSPVSSSTAGQKDVLHL